MKIDQILRSSRKSVALVITPDAKLVVRAPRHFPIQQIESLVQQKSQWIARQLDRIAKNGGARTPKRYQEGEIFYYLGESYVLCFAQVKKIFLREGVVHVPLQKQAEVKKLIQAWYKIQARQHLFSRIQEWSKQIGLQYKKLRLSSAKTRWGSCSLGGNISLSWRLIMLPPAAIDYVLVHELAHLMEHNHQARFWNFVGKILPDYREQRAWLRQHRHSYEV